MVHGASLCLDNVVEIFSGAVVSIAEGHTQVDNATMGLQLIGRMTEKGLIDGSEVLEVRKVPNAAHTARGTSSASFQQRSFMID